MKSLILASALASTVLCACGEKKLATNRASETPPSENRTPGIPEKSVSAGPVENIDTAERVEALKLMTIQDPIDMEAAIFRAEMRGAFEQKQFDFLEDTARELRTTAPLFKDGSWKLLHFYNALGQRINHEPSDYQRDMQVFQEWDKAKPKSLTMRIALIDFYTTLAWRARGTGTSDRVTKRMRHEFEQHLEVAAEILKEARTLPEKDPCLQYVGMRVALGQGWPARNFDQLVTEIDALAPTFYPAHDQRAYSLLPRWYGKTEKSWLNFADHVSKQPGSLGDEAYARMVIENSRFFADVFRDGGADWQKTRAGLIILREKYPESLVILNQTARLATMARDRKLAEACFAEIGDNILPSVWPKKERFVHFRTWARTGKW